MSSKIQPVPDQVSQPEKMQVAQVILYSHSALLYWWPLWAAGFVMAMITWLQHDEVVIGNKPEWFHTSRNLGVIYTLLLMALVVITSTNVRGKAAALVVTCVGLLALLFAYLGWWDAILNWLGAQAIYMNFGFYLYSSTALLVIWFVTVFIVDHLSFWRFRPGQVTHEFLWGIVDQSYDTDNMILTKRQDDLFRHWIIGLGSGDLKMQTLGGRGVEINALNVLIVAAKLSATQRLIATVPDLPHEA